MTRRTARELGPDLLRAAVADARSERLLRGARDHRIARDLVDGGPRPAARVGSGAGRRAPSASHVAVPSPSPAGDSVTAPCPRSDPLTYAAPPGTGPSVEPELAPEPVDRTAVEGTALEQVAVAPRPEGDTARSMALVRRAQAGDAEAFGGLYDLYVDMVYRYVHHRVASPQLAEDLTSETFLRALRRIGSFTWQGRDVGAWFVTIARNLVADHYKSGRYRLELTTDDVAASGPVPLEEGPEGLVITGLQNAALLEAVRRLGPEQQECIALRFLQGLSVSETAQVMGKNDGAVKALQYRAVKALGRLLPEGVGL